MRDDAGLEPGWVPVIRGITLSFYRSLYSSAWRTHELFSGLELFRGLEHFGLSAHDLRVNGCRVSTQCALHGHERRFSAARPVSGCPCRRLHFWVSVLVGYNVLDRFFRNNAADACAVHGDSNWNVPSVARPNAFDCGWKRTGQELGRSLSRRTALPCVSADLLERSAVAGPGQPAIHGCD